MLTLLELKRACRLYSENTNFDQTYSEFRSSTNPWPDLTRREHRDALLHWLRQWGARQFAVASHELASQEILTWYDKHISHLVPAEKNLWELTEHDLRHVRQAYASLSSRTAALIDVDGHQLQRTVGPAGTTKILFALRPRAFLPWDAAIRKRLRYGVDAHSYVSYLRRVSQLLGDLELHCQRAGFPLVELPQWLGRPDSSHPKIVDEYCWATLTRKLHAPNPSIIARLAD